MSFQSASINWTNNLAEVSLDHPALTVRGLTGLTDVHSHPSKAYSQSGETLNSYIWSHIMYMESYNLPCRTVFGQFYEKVNAGKPLEGQVEKYKERQSLNVQDIVLAEWNFHRNFKPEIEVRALLLCHKCLTFYFFIE